MDNDRHNSIEEKLLHAWRQERRFIHVRGAARFLIWLVALIALDFLIDWGLFNKAGLGGNIGLGLLVVNLGVLGWVLWHEWLRHLKPFDPVLVALSVEERHPALSSLVVSYTQLEGPTIDQPNVSPELIVAMRQQAVDRARPLDFREIVDFAQLKKLLIVAASVLLLFGILSIRWDGHFGALLKRLAGMDARYPTRTTVLGVSGDRTVRLGDSTTLQAEAEGILPEEGRLFTKPADSEADWKELPMRPGAAKGTFGRELKGLTRDLLYYVRIGDDRSGQHRIKVIGAPQIVETKVTLDYPAYMKRAAGWGDQLNLEVPEGTVIRWTLRCDPPVKRCEVIATKTTDDAEQKVEAEIEDGGKKVSFALTADEAFKYTFRWTEAASTKDFEYDDVQYSVRVVPDRIPEIELVRPAASGLATVNKSLEIVIRPRDDHGLDKAWLVYSVDGGEENRFELRDFEGGTGNDHGTRWKLQEHIPGLKPGSQISIAAEVADLHPDRADHTRRSATRQLTIVEPERYLEWFRAELAAQNEEIKRSRDAEATSSSNIQQIKAQEEKPK